jgi:hypothetical protein
MTGAEVAMAGNSDVIAVWKQSSGGVWASIRQGGGAFSDPVQISSGTGNVNSPRPALAVDPAGNAVAAWVQSDGSNDLVRVAVRPAGGAFGPPDTISAIGSSARDLDVAMDAGGNAMLVWSRPESGLSRVQWSHRPAGGAFPMGATITAGPTSAQHNPRLAMDPAGNAVVAYQAYDSPPNITFIRYQERPAGGAFPGDPGEKDVPPHNGNGSPPSEGAMDVGLGGGEIAFAWKRFEGGLQPYVYRGAIRTFGAAQASGSQFLDGSGSMDQVRLAMAPSWEAVVAWSSLDGNDILWAARAPGSATFGTAAHLAPAAAFPQTEIGLGLDGLAPEELFGGGSGVFFSSLSAGGDAQGNGFASAGRFATGGTTRLTVAGFDPVPPRLDSFSVPRAVNNPISFSVSPFDVWGPVTTGWDFGDGATAPGTHVSHTFPTPGQSYNVTATATDAAGNSASASALTVPNAPPALGRLSMRRRVFAVARTRTAIEAGRRRPKRGTAFRYTVSEPARVEIRIHRVLSGRRVGTTCRRPTPRLRKRPRCKRYVRAGRTLVRNVPAGLVKTKFSGRIGRRALRPGRYRATFVATDRLGLVSPARTIRFRIVSG